MRGRGGKVRERTRKLQKGVDYIGVTCVFFCHDGKGNFLLHKRSAQCRDEQGRWDNGGGSLEFGEEPEDAVRREVHEEYCVDAQKIDFLTVTNVLRKNGDADTHWIALIFAVKVNPAQVQLGESEKMDDLGWFRKTDFPQPLHSQVLRHFRYVEEAGMV